MLGNHILYVAGPYACSYMCSGGWDWCLNVVGMLIKSVTSSKGKAGLPWARPVSVQGCESHTAGYIGPASLASLPSTGASERVRNSCTAA